MHSLNVRIPEPVPTPSSTVGTVITFAHPTSPLLAAAGRAFRRRPGVPAPAFGRRPGLLWPARLSGRDVENHYLNLRGFELAAPHITNEEGIESGNA